MRMRTRGLPVSFVAWIALIALPASPSAARADDQWIQIGDGVHLPNPIPGRHNESGRHPKSSQELAASPVRSLACDLSSKGWGDLV